jgi:hypothetical protein
MKNNFNKFMKVSYNFSPLLHNRVILYSFCIVALFELVYFLSINDMYSFSTLILIGLLTSFFNKNMTVILFIAIVFTHVLKYGRSSFSEGMDNKEESESTETESEPSKKTATDSSNNVLGDLSKFKDLSDKINAMTGDEKKNDLIEHLQDIKETRDQIVENVQNMQPLFEKFQGYIEKFQDYKNSQKTNA